ncbi:MAG: MotA/TolQ/ExbB proton channel family protein [Planctomycetes bacterium]|nr:MotA/TolQ/ExbB proton channel family protein [Planctomycetota bacterium]
MDIATLIGLVLGAALVLMAILLGGDLMAYVNIPSVLIVIGGGFAATMASTPLKKFLQMPNVLKKTLFSKTTDTLTLIRQIVELAEVARRDGILALEGMVEDMDDDFLVSGIQMAVDGTDPEIIQTIMETELENLLERHEVGKSMFDALGRYAPAFGMIGTLIGLVAMLSNMDDPSKIGAGMAAALLTTLYGALLANILFLPLADKLAIRSAEEALTKTIVIQGVMTIQSGDNPRAVESKLMTFLPPAERPKEEEQAA